MNLGIGFGIWNLDLVSGIWNVDIDLETEFRIRLASGYLTLDLKFGFQCWIFHFNLGLGLESAY